MSKLEEAVAKLEKILEHNLCLSRRDELQEVLSLLKDEQKLEDNRNKG
ncbi:Uncharacterised protein [uncultured archaeon]|nr:Uncharacterised protein [uncultured archaeon]